MINCWKKTQIHISENIDAGWALSDASCNAAPWESIWSSNNHHFGATGNSKGRRKGKRTDDDDGNDADAKRRKLQSRGESAEHELPRLKESMKGGKDLWYGGGGGRGGHKNKSWKNDGKAKGASKGKKNQWKPDNDSWSTDSWKQR